jgi:hypothetical protein
VYLVVLLLSLVPLRCLVFSRSFKPVFDLSCIVDKIIGACAPSNTSELACVRPSLSHTSEPILCEPRFDRERDANT